MRVSNKRVMDQFAQMRPLPSGEGKTITFSRYSNLAVATTALTEGTNPSGSNLSATNVTAQIAQYGDYVKISTLVSLTALDKGIMEKIPILGDQAGDTTETLTRNEVAANATAQVVSTQSALSAITASDVLTSTDIKKAVRDLKNNKAMPFGGDFFACVVSPYQTYDFQGDTTWVSAQQYSNITQLYKNEIGKWFGVRFVETTLPYRTDTSGTASDSGTVIHTLVIGQEAYGVTELDGLRKKLYVYNQGNTENPLDMYSTCGWKLSHVAKTLNANFVIAIQSGFTA